MRAREGGLGFLEAAAGVGGRLWECAPALCRWQLSIAEQLRGTSVLELGSGTGQHAGFFLTKLSGITWQPSEQPGALQDLVDSLICQSAERLNAALPPRSLLAWQPGSGFVLLLEGRALNYAVLVVDQLLELLADKLQIEQVKLRPQWLAGLVEWPRQGSGVTELLRQASMALADAEPGDHRVAVYQAQRDEAYQRRLQLARDIPYAPRHNELSVVYQPKLALASGQVPQVEALMRWHHQRLGPIRPDEFIVLAEQTGSIALLTQWVLDAVLTQVREWLSRGIELQVAMKENANLKAELKTMGPI